MMITRKLKIPLHWAFFAQLPLILTIYGGMMINAPFLLMMKKFIDNPAAIMFLISLEAYITWLGGPFMSWLTDRIWTRWGRRKPFVVFGDVSKGLILLAMPFAPNLWALIILRWLWGIIGDLGAGVGPLIFEIVPPKQRGISSGFKSVFMNFGNLVFFTLVLARFDDVYFLGPFASFDTMSGGTIMFFLGALLLLGIGTFEALGIKEVYPPDRKRINDGRKPGENIFKHFARAIFKDVFGKDLLPLYMLMLAGIMFSFGLGMFGPLLFTEQWGYSLQDMGNTVAVGILLGVVISLFAGWIADKRSKIEVYFWALVGNLVVNIIYTIYVYYQPDFRPSLWEIILFGNLAYIFGSVKAVVAWPLLFDYVKKNRMGAAGAGMGLFGGLLRNTVPLVVGGWLFVWSVWFYPQGGYTIETTFSNGMNKAQVASVLEDNGVNLDDYILEPLHQYGVDGETSMRWKIHRNVEEVQALLDEKKDLDNDIAYWIAQKDSILTSEGKAAELDDKIAEGKARLAEVDEALEQGATELKGQLEPILQELRFREGSQILAADFDNGSLSLTLRTIEPLPEEGIGDLQKGLQGPEIQMRQGQNEEGQEILEPAIDLEPLAEAETEVPHAIGARIQIDPQFWALYQSLIGAGFDPSAGYNYAGSLIALLRSGLSDEPGAFTLSDITFQDAETLDAEGLLSFTLAAQNAEAADPEEWQELFQGESLFQNPEIQVTENGLRLTLTLGETTETEPLPPGIVERLQDLGLQDPSRLGLAAFVYEKLTEAAAAKPLYITVPQAEMRSVANKRVYEYFFSSQIIQIATDIIGIGIVFLIVYLEKRGTISQAGVEEDEER